VFRWGIETTFTLESDTQRGRRARIKEAVGEYLERHPRAVETEIVTHIQQKYGVVLTPPTLCRIRQELGLSPVNQQSRTASLRRQYLVESQTLEGQ